MDGKNTSLYGKDEIVTMEAIAKTGWVVGMLLDEEHLHYGLDI